MAIDGLRRMVENRGAETWDTFMDDNIITPIENKINELEESGGLDQETKDKIQQIIENGVSTNLYNPADSGDLEIYIDQINGNDITGDGSIGKPFASIERAWKRIPYIVLCIYKIKFIGNYIINNTLKCESKIIIHGKGSICFTSSDIDNRSNISGNYIWYFYGVNSYVTVVSETSYSSNFYITDINISCSLSMNKTNFLIKNSDNIKTDTSKVNVTMSNSIGVFYNTILSNGGNNFNVYNNSTLYFANSTATNPNGVNFAGYFFSKVYINKNSELGNAGVVGKMDATSTLINNIEVTE